MLIIAIPKSASTSLLHTLGKIYQFKSEQDVRSVHNNFVPLNFSLLGNYHGDCRELDRKTADKWIVSDRFYKQHIPPTENNIQLLQQKKKVILLRDPEDIILAYRRAENKGLHKTRTEFQGCITKGEWLKRAKEIGLYDELGAFCNGWQKLSTDKLLIRFEDLISDDKHILKKISQYFGLPINDKEFNRTKLNKHRYNRYNSIQNYTQRILKRFKKIFTVF